jgi:hypothetical protein
VNGISHHFEQRPFKRAEDGAADMRLGAFEDLPHGLMVRRIEG